MVGNGGEWWGMVGNGVEWWEMVGDDLEIMEDDHKFPKYIQIGTIWDNPVLASKSWKMT
jgi:hypothetical protein